VTTLKVELTRQKPMDDVRTGKSLDRPELSSKRMDGLWPGIVEYVADPLQQGRVKVRVFAIHGLQGRGKNYIPTESLPWAMPCFPGAGGQDYGSFTVPPVGSSVFVMFMSGDPDMPVVMGGFYAINKTSQDYLRSMGKPEFEISMAGAGAVWKGRVGPETPSEALHTLHGSPEVVVPAKSVKGAALIFDDKDEREATSLVDRGGQGLFMESELTKGANAGNNSQRWLHTAAKGVGPDMGSTVANETRLYLVDGAGQQVLLHAHVGSERLKLVSRAVEGDNVNGAGAKEQMAIELDAGSRRMTITASSGGDSGAKIILDAAAGAVEITGPVVLRLDAQTVEILGRIVAKGDLIVEGDSLLTGDVIITGDVVGGKVK
jgi:phage baseplate assembly protein gpV